MLEDLLDSGVHAVRLSPFYHIVLVPFSVMTPIPFSACSSRRMPCYVLLLHVVAVPQAWHC